MRNMNGNICIHFAVAKVNATHNKLSSFALSPTRGGASLGEFGSTSGAEDANDALPMLSVRRVCLDAGRRTRRSRPLVGCRPPHRNYFQNSQSNVKSVNRRRQHNWRQQARREERHVENMIEIGVRGEET